MAKRKMSRTAKVCNIMKPGWHIKEELPLFLVAFIASFAAMWYHPSATLDQMFGTAFLIAAVLVSLKVVWITTRCRIKK